MTVQSAALQIIWLFVLAIPVACLSWTCTHEEVLREPREYCHTQKIEIAPKEEQVEGGKLPEGSKLAERLNPA